ncbi:MAG: DUF484 family protein [Nitrosomonas sp.]|nr:DUF484 family protein [Nitrosomonas sp.]
MTPEDVVQYLTDHPDFFNEHAGLLTDMRIPYPQENKVVSLQERQVIAVRDKNRILQDKMLELIGFGEENDAISEKMHRLTIALLASLDLSDFLNNLNYSLREDFAIPDFVMRLWGVNCQEKNHDEFAEVSADIHAIAESLTQPYCGNHVADAIKDLFGEARAHLKSFSMIPLVTTRTIGLLVLASPELERFYADMGTLHLKRLGELISAAIARYDLEQGMPDATREECSDERNS